MVTEVNPPVYPLPRKLLEDPEVRGYFEELENWRYRIWLRTGGTTDGISENSTRETYPWILDDKKTEVFNYSITSTPVKTFRSLVINCDYTANPWEWLNVKKKSKVKFPKYPSYGDELIVRNGDGTKITLDGNGRKIDKYNTWTLSIEGRSIRFKYSNENIWYAI